MKEQQKTIEELERKCKRAYFKQWRANHKENVRKHNQNYWRKKALEMANKDTGASEDDNE